MTGQGQGQVGIRATPPVLMDHAVCFVLGGVASIEPTDRLFCADGSRSDYRRPVIQTCWMPRHSRLWWWMWRQFEPDAAVAPSFWTYFRDLSGHIS